ncbi:radical SAM protein [Marinilabiliaceae bacterium ANBcel2]|nr:radical SAM protein [Marinilabiliaceae bacterium ANBcel2]
MLFNPIKYDEPLFRPPGEGRSAIIQATIGCSWNRCAFCEMYTSKQFKTKPFNELKGEIDTLSKFYGGVKKVFLGDGDAFALSSTKLKPILYEINQNFGRLQRISAYASPKNILSKTDGELEELKLLGLKLLYIGIESGDDELLKLINKGETHNSTVEAIVKAHNAGIDTSVMIINGLGGREFSRQHAEGSALVINKTEPKFLSTLTLSFPYGIDHYRKRFNGGFVQQSVVEIMEELKIMIEAITADRIIFRSNHVSNNVALSGTLRKDKNRLIHTIEDTINETPASLMFGMI